MLDSQRMQSLAGPGPLTKGDRDLGTDFRVALVCMPFCYLESPSLALSQLRTVLNEDVGEQDRVQVDICYAQHDFAEVFGFEVHNFLADSGSSLIGDWLFSHVLFPKSEQDTLRFVQTHCPDRAAQVLGLVPRLNAFLDRLIADYRLASADVVGFTTLYQQTVASLALAHRLRTITSKPVIVMGGGNCEGMMGKALIRNFACLDYVFSGNALISFPLFVKRLRSADLDGCDRIDGVFSRRNECLETWDTDAVATKTPEGAVIYADAIRQKKSAVPAVRLHCAERPVNEVVDLDYADFLESFRQKVAAAAGSLKPRLPLETSRGCWWGEKSHCTFCGSCGWNIAYRQMDAERAVGYITGVVDRHKSDANYFECVDQLIPKDFPEKVMPRLKLDSTCGLFYEVRSSLSFDDMKQLRASGIFAIQPGIEALSSSLLRLMAKGVSAAQNVAHLRHCAELGIMPMWALLTGFPQEDEKYYFEYRRMLPSLFHLPPPMAISPIDFHRNSPYTWYAKKYDLELRPADVYKSIYGLPDSEMDDLAYFFEDRTIEAPYKRHVEKHLSELGVMIAIWRNSWVGHSGPIPQLHFADRNGATGVVDTRAGVARFQALTDLELAVLHQFADVRALAAVKRENLAPEQALDSAIASLVKRGLMFMEDDRGISLVLPGPTDVPPFVKMLRNGEVVLH